MTLLEEQSRERNEQLTRRKFTIMDELLKLKGQGVSAEDEKFMALERESFDITLQQDALGEKYYLKAMNCPHHHRIFAAEPHSYRDLPLRLAEYGTCYRYESRAAKVDFWPHARAATRST